MGGWEHLRAAVNNGADAVYLGGSRFNARGKAENFSRKEMEKALDYAHERDVRVYVTFNTLLKDRELADALDYAGFLYGAGADAIIVQDMGLARMVRRNLPDLAMHLSTQGTVYNPQAIDLVKAFGFSRVVPARELTREELRSFADACHGEPAEGAECGNGGCNSEGIEAAGRTSCEVEVFVHGALCMCYSGQCQMSRAFGDGTRSANRGLCAQPCRLPYTDDRGNTSCLLSPRDLCLLEQLPELADAGADSLKIEGRLKSPEYVAVTTGIYRKYLDMIARGASFDVDPEDIRALRQVYSRGEFTTGYFYGNPGGSILSGASPKHSGVMIGQVISVADGSTKFGDAPAGNEPAERRRTGGGRQKKKSGKESSLEREAAEAVRGAAKKGAVLIEAALDDSLSMGDSVELRSPADRNDGRGNARRGVPADRGQFAGGTITWMKKLPSGTFLLGDLRGDIRPGDEIRKTADQGLLTEARRTFQGPDPAAWDRQIKRRSRVRMNFSAAAGEPVLLIVEDGKHRVFVRSDVPAEAAVNRPAEPARVRDQLVKLGGTPFAAAPEDICVEVDGLCAVPAGNINELRRRAVSLLLKERRQAGRPAGSPDLGAALAELRSAAEEGDAENGPGQRADEEKRAGNREVGRRANEEKRAGNREPGWEAAGGDCDPKEAAPAVPLEKWLEGAPGIPELFPVTKGRLDALLGERFEEIADRAKETGIILNNLGWINRFLEAGVPVRGSRGLNVCNRQAEKAFEEMGVKILQWSWESVPAGQMPLMITEHPIQSKTLTDRKGVVHRVERSASGDKTIIY